MEFVSILDKSGMKKLKKEKIIKIKEEEYMFNTIRLLRGYRSITVK